MIVLTTYLNIFFYFWLVILADTFIKTYFFISFAVSNPPPPAPSQMHKYQ